MRNSYFITPHFKIFPQKPVIHIQLSLMMFLQFFVMGCTIPIVSLYMKDYLHFSGVQIGSVLAIAAMASFVSPLISTFVADRFISAERLLSIVHCLAATAMLSLSSQTTYTSFLVLYVLYSIILNPSGALTNAISFHHLPDVNLFGGIRLWGTIGWIAAAWVFGAIVSSEKIFILSNDLHSALQLSAIASLILSIYALFLPKGIGVINRVKNTPRPNPIKVVLDPVFLLLTVFSGLIMLIDRFYIFGAAPYIKSLGFAENDIMSILSIGQIPEILLLLTLGMLLQRIGFKLTILAGIGFEVMRFTLFAAGVNDLFLFMGILLHGITWALFFVPITIYIDKKSTRQNRAGVQQLYSFMSGTGVIAGNLIAGICVDFNRSSNETINYSHFWLVPMCLSVLVFVLFLLLFKEPVKPQQQEIAIVSTKSEPLLEKALAE
jgi:nucleoside transporter